MGQHCDSGELLEDIQYCIEGRTDEKEIKTEPNFKKFELQQKSVQLKKLDDDDDDEDDNENENDKKNDEKELEISNHETVHTLVNGFCSGLNTKNFIYYNITFS